MYLALDSTTGEMIAVKQVEAPKSNDERDVQHQMSLAKALKAESSLLQELDHLILFNIWASRRLMMS